MIVAAQLATRLWQRASAITWYGRHAAMFPSDAADCTTPAPVELVEPETGSPAPAPLQELEAGPEPENPEGSQQQP